MERVKIVLTAEEADKMLVNLPTLSSPLLKDDEYSPITWRSAQSVMKIKREKYKITKLNSTPDTSKFSLKRWSQMFNIESEYTFIETLGVGTYGEVKLASYKSDPTKFIAIKIAKGQTSINLLRNEAEILKKLNHECFPAFIDFKIDEISNKAYLIMEYLEGQTLDLHLENLKFSEEKALCNIISFVNAVKYLHSNKIAHRDLKPQNVIVTNDGHVKIIDFNISKKFVIRSTEDDNYEYVVYKYFI